MMQIYTFGMPFNIRMHLEAISDKFKFPPTKPPAPYNLDYMAIDYCNWMKNGQLKINPHVVWPNNPYQYVFGDRIVSSCLLNAFENCIIRSSHFVSYKPGVELFSNYIHKNSNHCGKSIEKTTAESYGITTCFVNKNCEIRLFYIDNKTEIEILDGNIADEDIPKFDLFSIMSMISKKTTLDFFALDCLYDGSDWWLSDFNTFPGTSSENIAKLIANHIYNSLSINNLK